jgi:DNA-binding transcriptional LysR family regulator
VDLSPQELRLLVAVARTGSFTAAGENMGLTQSAVSHAVRTCERRVGVLLFERGRTGARPTPAGNRVLVHARQILRQLEVLRTEALDAAAGSVSGTLRIAAFRTAAMYLLPPVVERLSVRYPQLVTRVAIVPEIGAGTAGAVAAGHADVALATFPAGAAVPPHSGELVVEPYFLVHPSGQDARNLPLIDWPENCSSYTRAWWDRQTWLPKARVEVDADDGVVLSMVAQGIGMAILPQLTLTSVPAGVTVVPLDDDPPTRRIMHVTTEAAKHSMAVRELVRELRRRHPNTNRRA